MTYKEANQEAKRRDAEYKQYCVDHNLKTLDEQIKAFSTMPDDLYNYSIVSRCGGFMIATGEDRVFEYPCGLMACSHIPEEAYLTQEELDEDVWSVHSCKEEFDW